jgi:uncharacterized protein (TIGR04141 family)
MATLPLNISLLKDTIASPDEALDPEKEFTSIELTPDFGIPGSLFLGGQKRTTPKWVAMLNPHLTEPIGSVYTASISAVLVVAYEGRHFALTFGHGRSLLNPRLLVRDFGLKVTLNRVDPARLRSMDSKIYDDLVVSTRKQLSRSGGVANFELDVGRALVRGVTGDAAEGEAFKRLSGGASLALTTELPFAQLDEILEELIAAYEDTVYQASFGWIDNIREVDDSLSEELDALLELALLEADASGAYLAPADVVDWSNIQGFSYTGGRPTVIYAELSIGDYLGIRRSRGETPTVEALKRHRVRVKENNQADWNDEWTVYDCVVWETDLGENKHVLFDGRWFEVEPQYASRVLGFVQSISENADGLPEGVLGANEEDYNASVEEHDPARFALLDRVTFTPTGGSSPIEFCDLLSASRQLIHVKKRYSSATLSHLFSQGAVSADLFLHDQELRAAVRQSLHDAGKPTHALLISQAEPSASEFEVVYAILAKRGSNAWPPDLPFFSAVNLMHHATRVRNLGFNVSLRHIRLA